MALSRIPISFGFQSRPGRYGQDGSCRIVNAYTEESGEEGKRKLQTYAIDGLRPKVVLPQGPVRAVLPIGNYLLVLSGYTVYRVASNWTYETVGIVDALGPAQFLRGRRTVNPQVACIAAGVVYIITGNAAFDVPTMSRMDDPDLPAVSFGTFINGYGIFGIADGSSGRFFVSALDDLSSVAALDYAVAESDPDRLIRPFRRRGELWLMGESSIEVWGRTSNAAFPFEPLPGAAFDRGCLSGYSVAMLEEMVTWVADDGTVRAAKGYAGERISHHAVERSIADEPSKPTISGMTITKEGHSFYVLSGTNFTWTYDHTTKLWHERESYRKPRWRGSVSCNWNGLTVVGDYETGVLYVSDPEYQQEGTDPIVMLMRGPILYDYPSSLQFHDMRLDVITGVGLPSGVGGFSGDPVTADSEEWTADSTELTADVTAIGGVPAASAHDTNPHAMLRYSDDGGSTWSNQKRGELGRIGKKGKHLKFKRMGQADAQGRIVELSVSAAVARALLGASAKVRRIKAR